MDHLEKLIVGDDPCAYFKVWLALKNSASSSQLRQNWKTLARELLHSDLDIDEVEEHKFVKLEEIIIEILKKWRSSNGEKATLANLCRAFENHQFRDFSESIQRGFPDTSSVSNPIKFTYKPKPLTVAVTRPTEVRTFLDDYYNLPVEGKGLALLINITSFKNLAWSRDDAKHDLVYMKDLWKGLGYDVQKYQGEITEENFKTFMLPQFIKQIKEDEPKSIVIFIGSHGSSGKFKTSDQRDIDLFSDVVYLFSHENCKELEGKPKIFILEACQDYASGLISPFCTNVTMRDTMVCYSSLPGHKSFRDTHIGSWFVVCLTKAFMENAYKDDLATLITKTQNEMKEAITETDEKQMCVPHPINMQKLYFNLTPRKL